MTSPLGRMSKFQQSQMFSLTDPNIHNIAVQGVFDDCQDMVKAVSNDLTFKRKHHIGTVNSINWARLLAQVVYYFAGYFQATDNSSQKVSFTVPSGNFGNVCAGHVARMMGLPIQNLVVATNENDVLDEFFRTGVYKSRASQNTFETSSPSMDISKASNFERFIFDLLGRDAVSVNQLFANELAQTEQFTLTKHPLFQKAKQDFGFLSGKSTHSDRLKTIRDIHQNMNEFIDPHTADGIKVALDLYDKNIPMLVLETALPIKFAQTIFDATGLAPPCPAVFAGLESLPQFVKELPPDVSVLKAFIVSTLNKKTVA
jgi:threonine synthase